jgi:hypothetical protein
MPDTEKPKTKKQAYFLLQAAVCDLLPKDAAEQTVRKHEGVLLSRITNTINGATKDLPLLVKIVETCLPTYTVPPHIKAFV